MKAVIFTHVLYLILIKALIVRGVSKCESKVELRAVLLSCPAKDSGCDDDDPLSQAMKSEELQILQADSRNFESLREEKERGFPSAVKDCKRKLVITLKVKNVGKIPCDDEYIVVDHVFDPLTGGRGRLLSPVVVKLRQEQMIQLYGLQFQRVVNSDPFEEEKAGDKTCSVDPENPTCGIAMYDGKPIPYSEGFCCSCDPHVNAKRQLSPVSHGESLLYRDSKLISQGNSRFLRQEKSGAIVNPELVQLKFGNADGNSGGKKGLDCGGIGDPLCWDKIPNYLLERDRKIICDKGDFMNELCKLRQHKVETGATSGPKYGGDDIPRMSDKKGEGVADSPFTTVAVDADLRGSDPLNDDNVNNVMALKSVIKALNVERITDSVPLWDGHGPVMGSRGKRENRRENKKLTLEEKLDRFVSSKKHLTNHRKRLLELSHRRFRKAEERCSSGPESQKIVVKGCAPDCNAKSSPPRYFFSHDRSIIDPLESVDVMMNSTCKSLKESVYEASKDKAYRKSEVFKSFKDDKQERLVDRSFYRREPKTEDNLMRKEKYVVGKISSKKGKVSHADGGRMESGAGKEMQKGGEEFKESLKDRASSRGDERFSVYKGAGKTEDEPADMKEEKQVTGGEIRGQYNAENFKSFLYKNEFEKKLSRPKIRNFFTAKSREKQKLRSELAPKKAELRHREVFEGEKRREHLKPNGNNAENQVFEEKKIEGRDKERESLKGVEDGGCQNIMHFTTEKSEVQQVPLNKGMPGERGSYKGDRKYLRPPLESRFHPAKDLEGNINFNVEIIRNHVPGLAKHRHHSTLSEQFARNRMDSSGVSPKTNVYNLNGKTQYLRSKQNPLLHYASSQSFYVLENDKSSPEDAFLIKNENGRFTELKSRPRLEGVSQKNRFQPNYKAYFYKKPNRHYYLPVIDHVDEEPSFGRFRQSLLPDRGDKLRETQSRGKRHSEPVEGVRRPVKIRRKRSASYSFQPALGFYESEFDPRRSNGNIIHELETSAAEEKEFQSPLNYPTLASLETSDREKNEKSASDKRRLIQSYLNAPDYVLADVEGALKGKRQSPEQSKPESPREGSACERDSFGGESAQDTAHCMRFGDLWYGMYTIKKPVISQIAGVQLFDKHSLCDGTTQWRDLTKGKMIRIGTFFSKAEDELPTLSLTFMGEKTKKVEAAIDPDNYFLLIPSHVSDPSKVNSYPQFEGGPAEYLLVQSKDISSGGECNMIGTSFEAFARQPDRCSQRRGSCLKRQPVDLWREDMEARIRGKRGKYFVENFGNVPNSPIKTYTNLTGEFLALEYYGEYTSTIEIEVKADSNAIIRKGSNAQISLVYIDSTYPKKTRIILSVLNIGLTSSYFRPRLGDCPPDLDPAWCPLEGPLVTIPPQQRHDFKLDLSGSLPSGQIYLTVQVLNQLNKQIASRKITIKRGDRCVCAFHCKCNCIGNLLGGRACRKLSLEEYRKAGYIGSFPFRGGAAASAPESILGNIHIVFLTASYLLLFLGVMKGILGVFMRRIGISGTRIITGPRELCGYYECELQSCSVLYDECGFPVHPTTCQPVQIVPICLEIIINFLFFFLYPLRGIWFLLLSLPCCRAYCSDFDGYCRHDEGDSDQKCSRPLLSKEPNPTCVHYNLTTVDSKKSKQEYLPYPAYKGDDDPLEEDDTEFVLQEMKRYRKK